jgi:hypothetical protein
MIRRHPDVGIGVRPRGPLVFRVAERLSLISDAIYLEAIEHDDPDDPAGDPDDDELEAPTGVGTEEQARAVARWIRAGNDGDSQAAAAAFPGRGWLRQPEDCSDREWILEIAHQYRLLGEGPAGNHQEPVGPDEDQAGNQAPDLDADEADAAPEVVALRAVPEDGFDDSDIAEEREAEEREADTAETVDTNENVADASSGGNVIVFSTDRPRARRSR